MSVVKGTEVDPGGAPLVDRLVTISLVASTAGEAPGYDPVADVAVHGRWRTRTDALGRWSAELVPNSLLVPAGTVYVVDVASSKGSIRHTISVPNGAGPYRVEDILAAAPAALPTAELTAHATLTTDAHGGLVATTDERLSDQRVPLDGSVTPPKLAPEAVTDASVASANKDGTAGTPSLRTLGPGRRQGLPGSYAVPHTHGAIVMSWDDGHANWYSILRGHLQSRHQHHTFFVTSDYIGADSSKVSAAQLAALETDGHEIGSHTKTHANLTTLTPAQRAGELDGSKTAIEAVIGAGKVTTFAYPYGQNGRNATIDSELYLRYERVVDAGQGISRSLVPWNTGRHAFLTPRAVAWTTATHADVLAMIRAAARLPVLACIFGHTPGVDMTEAQLVEALDLIGALGLPTLTYREAFPGEPAVLLNPGFEDGTFGWAKIESGAGQTMESVVDTPADGMPGARSLRLATTSDTSWVYATQYVPLQANTTYRYTGRARASLAGGTGSAHLRVQPQALGGVNSGGVFSSNTLAATAGWTALALEFTTNQDVRVGRIDAILINRSGEAWFDHLHLGPKANGSFG